MTNRQINIPYFTIRFLTLFCYFLPFVFFLSTCTSDLTSKDAFNKQDAILNEDEKTENKLKEFDKMVSQVDTTTNNVFEVLSEYRGHLISKSDNSINLDQDFSFKILYPTPFSLSGIGSVLLLNNILAQILLGFSFFLSLTSLLLWQFLSKRKLFIKITFLNICSILTFTIICIATNISILFGIWVLLFLLLIQLLTERQIIKTTDISNS